jgi:hypothetical protein
MSLMFGTAKVFALISLFFVTSSTVYPQVVKTDSIYLLPAGTRIRLRMDGEISSKFSSVNDTFLARVAMPVMIRDVNVLPAGTLFEGRITMASPAGLLSRNGRLDLQIETVKFSEADRRSVEGVLVRPLRASRSSLLWPVLGGSLVGGAIGLAAGSAAGAVIGAGLGGGIGAGASYSRKGHDIRLKDDDVFEIELKKDLVLPVLDY